MYVKQNKNHAKIGYGGYGNFGQVPQSTNIFTVGGTRLSVTGPAHEMGPATAVVGMLQSALSAAEKGQNFEAQAIIQNAKAMLPSTGSLRSKLDPLVATAETQLASSVPLLPMYIAPPAGMFGSFPIIPVVGGIGALIIIILLLKR